jgi:hypothetical protein
MKMADLVHASRGQFPAAATSVPPVDRLQATPTSRPVRRT